MPLKNERMEAQQVVMDEAILVQLSSCIFAEEGLQLQLILVIFVF